MTVQKQPRRLLLLTKDASLRQRMKSALRHSGITLAASGDVARWWASMAGGIAAVDVAHDDAWEAIALAAATRATVPVAIGTAISTAAAVKAFDAGARGVVSVDGSARDAVAAIRTIAAGSVVLPASAAARLFRPRGGPLSRLSGNDRELLDRIAEGRTVGALANLYGCTERTMYRRQARLLATLEVATREDAVAMARAADEP